MRYFIVSTLLVLTACSNPFGGEQSNVDEGHHPGVQGTFPGGAFSEILNMAQQNSKTPRGYLMSHSVGDLGHEVTSATPRGYQIYSGIQGVFVSGVE